MPQSTIRESLLWAGKQLTEAGCDTPVLDAELLAAHALGIDRSRLIISREHLLSDDQQARYSQLVERRRQREPLPYILGEWEFFSLKFAVSPAVLIPRPETETLVEACLSKLADLEAVGRGCLSPPQGVDVGCGSGAIAIALAAHLPTAKLFATESSPAAIEIAKQNCQRHNLSDRITFLSGNLLEPLKNVVARESLGFIAANLPYIPSEIIDTLAPEVGDWEPRAALDGGPDGLDIIRRLIADAPQWLKAQGFLALEISPEQAEEVKQILLQHNFSEPKFIYDLAQQTRVVLSTLNP
jgi:release factor glutamine methyltransferase